MSKKQTHHISISVGLREGTPNATLSVEGGQKGDPRGHLLVGHRPGRIRGHPYSTKESSLINPRLIDIDNPAALFQNGQHLEGILLSQN